MASDGTVLEHLLEGRDALVQEVKRLTTAIEELDSVIARIGGGQRRDAASTQPVSDVTPTPEIADSPGEVEPVTAPPAQHATAAKRAPAKSTGSRARTSAPRRRAAPQSTAETVRSTPAPRSAPEQQQPATGQKSIRVRVLEMLGAEDRDFGLAEIIDRIHAEGIQAHDDAVRSITIKLMKDGRVERVGRGMYRLARRSGTTPPPAPSAPAPEQVAGYVPPLDLSQSWQRPGS